MIANRRLKGQEQGHKEPFYIGLARAFAGALLFAMSLHMTMEMWWLGFYMSPNRLLVFTVVTFGLLVGLARYRGFRKDESWGESVEDALVGYAVGIVTAALLLPLLGVIEWGMPWREVVGKIALQATAGSMGALLAQGQLGGGQAEDEEQDPQNYWAELFLMVAGALFVAYTVAPTEEIALIGYMMTPWHALLTVLLSLAVMHTFVYEVGFRGGHGDGKDEAGWVLFLRFTVVGYALVWLASLYILWTFGRLDDTGWVVALMGTVVLSLPGALGAAAARLIL
jgi:putative integral membrane protein (TIGR02587 family)